MSDLAKAEIAEANSDHTLVATPSIPFYYDQLLNPYDRKVVLSGSYSGTQLNVIANDSDAPDDHGFYTGDKVYYQQLAQPLLENLHRSITFGELGSVDSGNFFLCRQTEMRAIAKKLKDVPINLRDAYTMCLSPTTENSIRILENFASSIFLVTASILSTL